MSNFITCWRQDVYMMNDDSVFDLDYRYHFKNWAWAKYKVISKPIKYN